MKFLHHFLFYVITLFCVSANAIDLAHYQTSCGPLPIFFHVTACVQDTATNQAIVAGYYVNASGYKQMFVARLVANGSDYDTAVGTCYYPEQALAPQTGYTVLGYDTLQDADFAQYNFVPTDIIVDASNNIIILGTGQDASLSTNPTDIFIARFDSDLVLDTSFQTEGFIIFPATAFGITQPTPPAVQIGITGTNLFFDTAANRYMFLIQSSNNVQSGLVALSSVDGSLDGTFNNVGYNVFSNTSFGGQATDYFSLQGFTKGTDGTNPNYYVVGGLGLNGIVVAVTLAGILQVTGTFAGVNGYLVLTSALLGQPAGTEIKFFGIVQNATPTNFYIAGECGQNVIVIGLLQLGTGLNTGFNATGETFGATPGVAVVTASLLGSSSTASVYNFYRDSANNVYLSGIAGNSVYVASILANGSNFNTAFGLAGAGKTLFSKTDLGFSLSDTIKGVAWEPELAYTPADESFLLVTINDSDQNNTASFVRLTTQGQAIDGTYGDSGDTIGLFAQFFFYQQHLVLDIDNVNIHVLSLGTPVGQGLQILEEIDDPLHPSPTRRLILPQVVLNITDTFFDGEKIVVVSTQFGVDDTGASVAPVGHVARFTNTYVPDTTFNTEGYVTFDGTDFGGAVTDPVIFMAGIQDETDGNYFVGGSIKIAPQTFYRALLTKVQNDGSGLVTTFNSALGYKTYVSDTDFGGTGSTNSVFTVLFQSPVGTSTQNQVYFLATTNISIVPDIVPYFYPAKVDGVNRVNGSELGIFTQFNITTGALTGTMVSIDQFTFGDIDPGASTPDTQLIDILQVPYTELPDGSLEENAFYIGLNLFGAQFHTVDSSYCAVLKYHSDLSGLVDDGSFGYTRDVSTRGFGISLFDSEDFGITISAQSLVAGTTLALLNNENVLFAGYACIDYTDPDPLFQTLVMQLQDDGAPNQRFNTTGYLLGGTDVDELGYMTSFAGGVVAASGMDGGVFVFGQGISSALKNVIEIALRRRYGL